MNSHFKQSAQRGSALVTVMMLALGLIIIISSILGFSMTERRLNHRSAMRLEGRNAAEAISEYGMSQVRKKMETRSDFTSTRFTSGGDTISMPGSSFWSGSHVLTASAEMVVGLIVPKTNNATSTLYYFDPSDPNNEFEPLKGRYAFRFDVRILSKATVNPPTGLSGGPQTVYMTQTLSARASPLFSHAVFYNMDLEVWPGPNMNIIGAVHTNGNLYVKKQSSNGTALNFLGPVTVAGGGVVPLSGNGPSGLYASGSKVPFISNTGSSDNLSSYTDNVYFSTAAGGLVALKNSSGTWQDQKWGQSTETAATDTSFRNWASQTFNGNLQTPLHGVQVYNPVAIGNYVEDPTPTNGVDNSVNDARKIIERPLLSSETGYSSEVESQKYSTRSGIYIVVNPSATDMLAAGATPGHKPDGTKISVKARSYRVFKNDGTEIVLPGQPTYGDNNASANATTNRPAASGVVPVVTIRPDEMTDIRRATFTFGSSRSASNVYTPKAIDTIDIDMTALKMAVDRTINGATQSTVYATTVPTVANWSNFIYNPSATTTTVTLGTAQDILNPVSGSAITTADWNGGVYVESINAEGRKDSGVRLINGRGRTASASDGSGLTVATNDALYILGHYNADGTINTATSGTTNSGRYNETSETPTSVAADAVTILSAPTYSKSSSTITQTDGWNDALSAYRHSSSSWSSSWATSNPSSSNAADGLGSTSTSVRPYKLPFDSTSGAMTGTASSTTYGNSAVTTKLTGADTEISCAILTGIVPSNKDGNGQASGGLHNFPRFLEYWDGTCAIRGSMVAMFESRVATEPWSLRVYSAPTRLWGFNELFNTGHFPPLTPRVMSYRRVDFNDITKSEYDSVKASWGL